MSVPTGTPSVTVAPELNRSDVGSRDTQQAALHPIDLAACKFEALYDFMMRYSGVRGEFLCNFFFYVCIIIGFQDGKKECLYKLWWCYVM